MLVKVSVLVGFKMVLESLSDVVIRLCTYASKLLLLFFADKAATSGVILENPFEPGSLFSDYEELKFTESTFYCVYLSRYYFKIF